MKKFTIFTIAFALVCSLAFGFSVYADEPIPANPGENVTVTFDLGKKVASGDYTIKYEPSILTFVSASPVVNQEAKDGVLHVNFFAGQESGIVDKLTVTFSVNANATGSTNLEFTPSVFGDFDSKPVDVSAQTITLNFDKKPVENEVIDNEVVDNEVVENDVVENDVVENNVVENEVDTPSTTNTTKNDNDDKKTYDQTGANIAIVAVIALAVVLGSAIVIKRK